MKSALRIFAYVYTAAGSLGFIANIIQLVLSRRNKTIKNSSFGLAIISLNIADLLASASFVVAGLVFFAEIFNAVNVMIYRDLTLLLTAAIVFSMTLSFTHVAFIAIQRVIGVVFPFDMKQIVTKTRSYVILVFLWLTSLVIAIIRHFYVEISIVLSFLAIIIGAVLIIMYSVISFKAMKRNVVSNVDAGRQGRSKQSDKEILLYSSVITIIFIVCNFPMAIKNFVTYSGFAYIVSNVLFGLNPLLDTLLYFVWTYYKQRRQANINRTPREVNLTARRTETAL